METCKGFCVYEEKRKKNWGSCCGEEEKRVYPGMKQTRRYFDDRTRCERVGCVAWCGKSAVWLLLWRERFMCCGEMRCGVEVRKEVWRFTIRLNRLSYGAVWNDVVLCGAVWCGVASRDQV